MQQSMLGWMRVGLLATVGLALGCGGGDTSVLLSWQSGAAGSGIS